MQRVVVLGNYPGVPKVKSRRVYSVTRSVAGMPLMKRHTVESRCIDLKHSNVKGGALTVQTTTGFIVLTGWRRMQKARGRTAVVLELFPLTV
tara:strand:+ start:164 stop:439 length:276 start_codon:yes stop_codon:yes gene_type:complete